MTGIASAATAVAIGFVAGGTSTIRVGAGGIMLPNHSPLVIAEQFGTLATLYPGRIDLGLGRAPGTDQRTWRALRRDPAASDRFPQDVLELQALLGDPAPEPGHPRRPRRGHPRAALDPRLQHLRRPARRRISACLTPSPRTSRPTPCPRRCRPIARASAPAQIERPHAMVGVNVIAADTDAEARRLFTSPQQSFANMFRGARGKLPPPIDDIETYWTPMEKVQACGHARLLHRRRPRDGPRRARAAASPRPAPTS